MKIQDVVRVLTQHWAGNPGVPDTSELDRVEAGIRQCLPADYKWFMMRSDGGETLLPYQRFCFYPVAELLVRRQDGQPPGALEIATDDSSGFAFDLSRNRDNARYPVIKYPLGDRDRSAVEDVAPDFASFLRHMLGLNPVPGPTKT